jgi:hypothetical protein
MTSIFRKLFPKPNTDTSKPDTGETVVNPPLNPIDSKYYISDYKEGTYKIGDSKISYDDTNAYYLCSIWYPTYKYERPYGHDNMKNDSILSFELYDVFINNPTLHSTSELKLNNPTTRHSTSELKLNYTYNLMKSLKNNYTNKTSDSIDVTKTSDSIDVTNLSDESMDILKQISFYMNMIEVKKMMNNTIPVADITYSQDELKILADIRDLIVKGLILLRASGTDTSTKKCIYYMESPAKDDKKDEKKGGKRTSRRTGRRARKSKKSIRKSKLRRRHRK